MVTKWARTGWGIPYIGSKDCTDIIQKKVNLLPKLQNARTIDILAKGYASYVVFCDMQEQGIDYNSYSVKGNERYSRALLAFKTKDGKMNPFIILNYVSHLDVIETLSKWAQEKNQD